MKRCPHCEEPHEHFCKSFSCRGPVEECFECHEELKHPTRNGKPSPFMMAAIMNIMEKNVPYGNGTPLAEEDIKYLPRTLNSIWVRNPGVTFGFEGIALGNYFRGRHELLSELFD